MHEMSGTDELASERTLLAAQQTFSAWIRTRLAGVGGGLAVPRVLKFNSGEHLTVAHLIGRAARDLGSKHHYLRDF